MKMNVEKYLPIGTVVLLKDAKKRVMITGFACKSNETGNKMFDYMGCLYPEGIINSDKNLMFDHDQIDKVFFIGYRDPEWITVEERLKDLVNKMNNI